MPQYRLIDHRGAPHPVLDDLYDSLDAAWSDARSWWEQAVSGLQERSEPMAIGIEVSTTSGSWRTVRHPG
ncbi:MAG: hypothetical protein ACKO5M_11065 [Vulcanococcus sp.]